jgi:hypothetical protein
MNFEKGLVVELSAITGLTGKVYPAYGGQKVTAPHVIYLKIANNNGREEDLQGHEGLIEELYQIDIYHSTKDNLNILMDLILTEIKTFNFQNIGITGPYIQHCKIVEDFDIYDEEVNLWRGIITIQVSYRED